MQSLWDRDWVKSPFLFSWRRSAADIRRNYRPSLRRDNHGGYLGGDSGGMGESSWPFHISGARPPRLSALWVSFRHPRSTAPDRTPGRLGATLAHLKGVGFLGWESILARREECSMWGFLIGL